MSTSTFFKDENGIMLSINPELPKRPQVGCEFAEKCKGLIAEDIFAQLDFARGGEGQLFRKSTWDQTTLSLAISWEKIEGKILSPQINAPLSFLRKTIYYHCSDLFIWKYFLNDPTWIFNKFLSHGIIGKPLCVRDNVTLSIDEHYKCTAKTISLDAQQDNLFGLDFSDRFLSKRYWQCLTQRIHDGSSLSELIEEYLSAEYPEQDPQAPLYETEARIFTDVKKPKFEKEGAQSYRQFDWIKVDVTMSRYFLKEDFQLAKQLLIKHRKYVNKKVIQKIKESPRFQQSNIPINCLKLDSLTLCRDFTIEYIFSLKQADGILQPG